MTSIPCLDDGVYDASPRLDGIMTAAELEALSIELELAEREMCRRRLQPFVRRFTADFLPGWHIDELCAFVEEMEEQIVTGRGEDARGIVEMPPRHAKSQVISRCTPIWYLGRHPGHEIIVTTYNQDLADDLGRWAKQAIRSPLYQQVFPHLALRSDSRAVDRIDTVAGGGIRYVGAGGAITGRGATLAIVDDPHKNREEANSETISAGLWSWYSSTLRTRLAPSGGIIVLHTRWNLRDLIGRLRRAMLKEEGERYRILCFPALAKEDEACRKKGEALHPARYPVKALEALRKGMLTEDWLALYQQSPMAEEGNIFKVTDFQLYKPGTAPKSLYWYVSTDLAVSTKTSADNTCIWAFGLDAEGHVWWHPDITHGRMQIDASMDAILDKACALNAHGILIEGGVIWRTIEPELKRRMQKRGRYFQFFNPFPTADKLTRSRGAHARMAHGTMHFPDTRYVREIVIPEFLVFSGKDDEHDDVVDTVSLSETAAAKLILPSGEEVKAAQEEDIPDGCMEDIERRSVIGAPRRPHSPDTLRGKPRKSGKEFRYA